jgi:hypothetical protein
MLAVLELPLQPPATHLNNGITYINGNRVTNRTAIDTLARSAKIVPNGPVLVFALFAKCALGQPYPC